MVAQVKCTSHDPQLCSFSTAVVWIGFNSKSYSVNETEGRADIFVEVLRGRLERPAEVNVTFTSGTAIGKSGRTL